MNLHLVLLLFVSSFSLGSSSETFAADLCNRSREDILQALDRAENQISFPNHGGLIHGGVCWWHSRLQRSSLYLATYAPEKEKPTAEQVQEIAHALTFMTHVVEIPGYQNFAEFTQAHHSVLQKALEHWQIRDGFLNQQWIRGISGKWQTPADELKQRMNFIYETFIDSDSPLWLMVQLKGITSHAFLLQKMQRTSNGFLLGVLDSNFPGIVRILTYHFGDEWINGGGSSNGGRFTPYLGFQKDMKKINSALTDYCQK